MRRLFRSGRSKTTLSWLSLLVVLGAIGWTLREGQLRWSLFGVGLFAIMAIPPAVFRSAGVTSPWPITAPAALTLVVGVTATADPVSRGAAYTAAAAVALLLAAQLDAFTTVEMNRGFGVAFVVMATMTAAGLWELGQWVLDFVAGTTLVESNEAVMWRLIWATAGGILDGIAAALGTGDLVLAQHGLDDTMSDLLANTVGALFVASVATVYRLR